MGTKEKPGAFDCYVNAAPDEPMFVLLARDRHAADLVRAWAALRELDGEDPAVVTEARGTADQMDLWRLAKRPLIGSDVAQRAARLGALYVMEAIRKGLEAIAYAAKTAAASPPKRVLSPDFLRVVSQRAAARGGVILSPTLVQDILTAADEVASP